MRCCPLGQSCQLLPLEDQKLRQPRVFISTQKPDSVKDLSIQGNQHREPCHCGLRFVRVRLGEGGMQDRPLILACMPVSFTAPDHNTSR